MKNYKIIIALMIMFLGFSSCEGYLDREPLLEDSKELILGDKDGINDATAALYSHFYRTSWYAAQFPIITDLKGNNSKSSPLSSGRYLTEYNWYQTPSNTMAGLWGRAYMAITAASDVIDAVAEFELLPGQEQVYLNHMAAEALFVRALSHFDLVRVFAQPFTHQPDGPGVPVITKREIGQPARNTTREVYQQIEDDLEESLDLFMDIDSFLDKYRAGAANPRGFASEDAARALLARVHLYMGDYTKAALYANQVIASPDYELYTEAEYETVWGKNAQSEIIFEISGSMGNTGWPSWEEIGYLYYPGGSYGDICASNDLLNLFEPGDVRANMFVEPDDHPGFFWPTKYPGKGLGGGERENNIPVFRLSEMYLIVAEAKLNGVAGNALDEYNEIRNHRGLTDAASVNMDNIFDERRRELCFEGHVLFDYARLKKTLIREDEDERLAGPTTINFPSYLWAAPIPIGEMEANPNMDQNDGY